MPFYKKYVIANAQAGGFEKFTALEKQLHDLGFHSLVVSDGRAVAHAADRAIRAGADLLVAAGGDGTVTSVANAILNAELPVTLGIIPLGTGNDFSRNFSIPLDAKLALEFLGSETRVSADAIKVSSLASTSWMLNMATGGSTTITTQQTTHLVKKRFKSLAYFLNSWRAYAARRVFTIEAHIDRAKIATSAQNVVIANGATCGGGFLLSPKSNVSDGKMEFLVVRPTTLLELLGMATKLLTGRLHYDPKVDQWAGVDFEIRSQPTFELSVDGEVSHKTPIKFQLFAKALTVVGHEPVLQA